MEQSEVNKDKQQQLPDRKKQEHSKQSLRNIDILESIKDAEAIAEYIIESDTFGLVFEKTIEGKDGKRTKVKNKNDVITAIVTGRELGLTPMASIVFGKQLDRHAFFKVMKGAALGLDPITSLDQINVISTSRGDIIHTGINVIASALLKNDISFEVIEDAEPEYSYFRIKDDAELGATLEDNYFVLTSKTDPKKLQDAKTKGDIIVLKKLVDVKTTVRLTRHNSPPFTLTYRRSQAIEADLYKGTKKDGTVVEGKANWNNHLETMLRNRALTIAGRIYGADVLQGTYSNEEAQETIDLVDGESYEDLDKRVNSDLEKNIEDIN